MDNGVIFSVKYSNPKHPDENWAADWKLYNKSGWSMSSSPTHRIRWCNEGLGLNELARLAVLNKFGLLDWAADYPLEQIQKMSPAELTKERRAKESLGNFPLLDIFSDNMDLDSALGQILHYAEDYK